MTSIDTHTRVCNRAMTGGRLCASLGLFMLCNFAGAGVIPLIAMALA